MNIVYDFAEPVESVVPVELSAASVTCGAGVPVALSDAVLLSDFEELQPVNKAAVIASERITAMSFFVFFIVNNTSL
jgi:hypothetical protein